MALLTFDFLSETSRPFKTEDMEILKRGKNHFAFRTALSLFFFSNEHGAQILQPNCGRILCDPGKGCTQVNIFLNVDFLLENCLTNSLSRPLCCILIFSARQVAFDSQCFSTMGKPIERQRVCTLATKFFSLLTTQSLFTSIQFSVIKTVCWCVCLFPFVVVFRNANPCCILPVSVVTLYANGYGEQNIFCCPDFFFLWWTTKTSGIVSRSIPVSRRFKAYRSRSYALSLIFFLVSTKTGFMQTQTKTTKELYAGWHDTAKQNHRRDLSLNNIVQKERPVSAGVRLIKKILTRWLDVFLCQWIPQVGDVRNCVVFSFTHELLFFSFLFERQRGFFIHPGTLIFFFFWNANDCLS